MNKGYRIPSIILGVDTHALLGWHQGITPPGYHQQLVRAQLPRFTRYRYGPPRTTALISMPSSATEGRRLNKSSTRCFKNLDYNRTISAIHNDSNRIPILSVLAESVVDPLGLLDPDSPAPPARPF